MKSLVAAIVILCLAGCPASTASSPDATACAVCQIDPTKSCTAETVRTAVWVRFWKAHDNSPVMSELPCSEVLDDGWHVAVGPLGGGSYDVVSPFNCFSQVHTDPTKRYGTGIFTYDQPRYRPYGLVVSNGSSSTVEEVVTHTPLDCQFGANEVFVSVVLP